MSTQDSVANYPTTKLLRNNPGMVRDCWMEKGSEGVDVLVIRQIKFDSNGSGPEAKVIRLVGEEIADLYDVIHRVITT